MLTNFYAKLMIAILVIEISMSHDYRCLWLEYDFTLIGKFNFFFWCCLLGS